jgi:glycosidase
MRWGTALVMFVAGCGPSTIATELDLAAALSPDLSSSVTSDLATTADDLGSADLGVASVAWRQQVIYLALVDRFFNGSSANDGNGLAGCLDANDPQKFHGGDFVGVTQKLPYLSELGATALWITPANLQAAGPVGRCGYHGYWADFTEPDDGAIEPRFGSAAELTALIEALHTRGMRFILDMVVNHAGDGARLPSQKAAWFHDPATCSSLGDPAVYCPYRNGVHDFAQENAEAAAYLDAFSAGWAQRFVLDGIRMDTAKYVPIPYFRDHWAPAVRAVRPLFLIAEVFSESTTELTPYLDGGFDSAFNFPLRRALIDAFAKGGSVDAVAAVIADEQQRFGARALDLVNLLDNHDTMRFASEPGSLPDDELQKRLRLGLIALFTLPGIPQIYTGDELGILGANDPDNRRDMPSWAWADADRAGAHAGALPDARGTFAMVKRLTALRTSSSALSDGAYQELWRQNGGDNLYVFSRGGAILAAFNNEGATVSKAVPVTQLGDGTIVDDRALVGAPTSLAISDGKLRLALPARTAGVYQPRDPNGGSAVTFTVQAPMGSPVAVVGSTAELGQWDPARAIQMLPVCNSGNCTWSVTVRVLPFSQSMELKFLRLAGTPMWEGGANRSFTVPAAATATFDGGNFQ